MKLLSLLAVFVLGGASLHAATTYICFGVPSGNEYVPQAGDNMVRINFGLGSGGIQTEAVSQTITEGLNNGVITSVTTNIGAGNKVKVTPTTAVVLGKIDLFEKMKIDQKVYNNSLHGDNETTIGNVATQSSTTMTLALGGFAANTTYTITLLSARAVGNSWSPSANFSLTGINTTVSLESLGAGGTPTANGVTGLDTSSGKAAAITWTFTTGTTDLDNLLLTAEGKWSMNALVINSTPVSVSVPEPSAAALGLFGLAGLMLRRKRN